jgi:hypothetical protein
MAGETEHPVVTELYTPVRRVQGQLQEKAEELRRFLDAAANETPHLSDLGRQELIRKRWDEQYKPAMETLRAQESKALADAFAKAERMASEPRHPITAPLGEAGKAALEGLRNMPASVLRAALRDVVKDGRTETIEGIRRLALQRATGGRLYAPDRADGLPIDAESWPVVNVMERSFGDGTFFEPIADNPAASAALIDNWQLLKDLASCDEATMTPGTRAVRALVMGGGHRGREVDVPIDLPNSIPLEAHNLFRRRGPRGHAG